MPNAFKCLALAVCLTAAAGCAVGESDPTPDSGPGADLGIARDSGVDVGQDAGPQGTVGVCEICETSNDCDADADCVSFGGRNLCLPRCGGEFAVCPATFECVNVVGTSGTFCVATACCIDRDRDGYGLGIDCIDIDCDDNVETGANINPTQDEICDGIDNNCVDGVDEQPAGCPAAGCGLGVDSISYEEFGTSMCTAAACTDPARTSCGNYTCSGGGQEGQVCATTCLVIVPGVGAVQDDSRCTLPTHCNAAGACVPDVVDGEVCSEDSDCGSGYCDNGFCCSGGTCCGTQDSDCPGAGQVQAVCEQRGSCQGTRGTVECNTATHSCTTMEGIPDDTACMAAPDPARECGLFRDTFCDGTVDQTPADTDCLTQCTDDNDCDAGAFCNDLQRCEIPREDGRPCLGDNYCANDYCANGFCCDGRTGDDCCGNVDDCDPGTYATVRTCSSPATCTGVRQYATCVDNICDSMLNPSDFTACSPADVQSNCGLYPNNNCTGTSVQTVCQSQCADDSDCDGNAHCDPDGSGMGTQVCVSDVGMGGSCDESSDCTTGHCFNGFCCNPGGVCCNGAGTCPSSFTTPATCTSAPGTGCQGSQFQATCINNECGTSATPTSVPSACAGVVGNFCGLFLDALCQPNGSATCPASCTSNAQCDPGANCTGGTCVPNAGQGGACTNDSQCSGGLLCIDNVCCNSPSGRCAGECEACNVTGSVGICAPILAGEDPANECAGVSCAGYYGGFNGDNCRVRENLADGDVGCRGGSSRSCQTAADLCPTAPATAGPLTCNASCQNPVAGTCTGTSVGQCQNISGGTSTCGVGACFRSVNSCNNGAPQSCVQGSSSAEVCNRIDDDCDGQADDRLNISDRTDSCTTSSSLSGSSGDNTWGSVMITEALYNPDAQNPAGDVDYYYMRVDASGDCFGDVEGGQFDATLVVPGSASGSYQVCIGWSSGSACLSNPTTCTTVAPGASGTAFVQTDTFSPGFTGCGDWTRYATVRVRSTSNSWSCDNYVLTLRRREFDP